MAGYYIWLIVISIAILYNIIFVIARAVFIFVIARAVFDQLALDYSATWYTLDYLCDTIYLLDMLVRLNTGDSI